MPVEGVCRPAECVMDGSTVVLLMDLMSKVMYHFLQQYNLHTKVALMTNIITCYCTCASSAAQHSSNN